MNRQTFMITSLVTQTYHKNNKKVFKSVQVYLKDIISILMKMLTKLNFPRQKCRVSTVFFHLGLKAHC